MTDNDLQWILTVGDLVRSDPPIGRTSVLADGTIINLIGQ
jgi:hypothetical protein